MNAPEDLKKSMNLENILNKFKRKMCFQNENSAVETSEEPREKVARAPGGGREELRVEEEAGSSSGSEGQSQPVARDLSRELGVPRKAHSPNENAFIPARDYPGGIGQVPRPPGSAFQGRGPPGSEGQSQPVARDLSRELGVPREAPSPNENAFTPARDYPGGTGQAPRPPGGAFPGRGPPGSGPGTRPVSVLEALLASKSAYSPIKTCGQVRRTTPLTADQFAENMAIVQSEVNAPPCRAFYFPYIQRYIIPLETSTALRACIMRLGIAQGLFGRHILNVKQGQCSDIFRVNKRWDELYRGGDLFVKMDHFLQLCDRRRFQLFEMSFEDAQRSLGFWNVTKRDRKNKVCASREWFSEPVTNFLTAKFMENQNPEQEEIVEMARHLQLDKTAVKTWFANRRSRQKNVRNLIPVSMTGMTGVPTAASAGASGIQISTNLVTGVLPTSAGETGVVMTSNGMVGENEIKAEIAKALVALAERRKNERAAAVMTGLTGLVPARMTGVPQSSFRMAEVPETSARMSGVMGRPAGVGGVSLTSIGSAGVPYTSSEVTGFPLTLANVKTEVEITENPSETLENHEFSQKSLTARIKTENSPALHEQNAQNSHNFWLEKCLEQIRKFDVFPKSKFSSIATDLNVDPEYVENWFRSKMDGDAAD